MPTVNLGIERTDGDVLYLFAASLAGISTEQAYRLRKAAEGRKGTVLRDDELRQIFTVSAEGIENPYEVSNGEHGFHAKGRYGTELVEIFRKEQGSLSLKLIGNLGELAAMLRGVVEVDDACWRIESEHELLSVTGLYQRGLAQ